MADSPLALQALPLHKVLASGATTTEYVLLQLRVTSAPAGPRPRLTAVLVLDVSGSMEGEPIAQVIRSAERLSEILSPEDGLGVVAFATAARTVAPIRPLSDRARKEIQKEVRTLAAEGYTNLSAGIAQAALLFPRCDKDERQIALVLSDGKPNVGTHTKEGLAEEVTRAKERDIAVSTLGFGADHDEDLLIALADAGGGRYAFIKDPRLSDTSFAGALGAQRDVIAENVHLLLSPCQGVELVRVLGDPKVAVVAEGLRLTLQDTILGDALNIVVELNVTAPRDAVAVRLLNATLAYRTAGTHEERAVRDDVTVRVVPQGQQPPAAADATVQAGVAVALVDEMREEARSQADRGNFAGAAAVLRKALSLVEGTPGFVAGAEGPLGDAREALLDEIAAMERAPDPEQYRIFRKAQRDYLDLKTGGTKMRGGSLQAQTSPSAQGMVEALQRGPVPKAWLVVIQGAKPGSKFPVKAEMYLGRAGGNDVVLADAAVTRRHARLSFLEGVFWLMDLGSSNPTLVNGKRIDRWPLSHGDLITMGGTKLRFDRE